MHNKFLKQNLQFFFKFGPLEISIKTFYGHSFFQKVFKFRSSQQKAKWAHLSYMEQLPFNCFTVLLKTKFTAAKKITQFNEKKTLEFIKNSLLKNFWVHSDCTVIADEKFSEKFNEWRELQIIPKAFNYLTSYNSTWITITFFEYSCNAM